MRLGPFDVYSNGHNVCRRCQSLIVGTNSYTGGFLCGHMLACRFAHEPPRSAFEALAMFFFALEDFQHAVNVAPEHARGYAAAWFETIPVIARPAAAAPMLH